MGHFIHQFCLVEEPSLIGQDTTVQPFTHIMGNTIIGANCDIGQHVSIGSGVIIGNRVQIQQNVVVESGVILEDGVTCGACTVFSPMTQMRAQADKPYQCAPTLVKQGSMIGPNTTIANGVRIGRFTFIEAGSVVDRNVSDYQVVYGNPLKVIGWRCACKHWLSDAMEHHSEASVSITCEACGKVYWRRSAKKIVLLEPAARDDSHSGFNPPIPYNQGFHG